MSTNPFQYIPEQTDWHAFFEIQKSLDYWNSLMTKVSEEYASETCFPPASQVFNAFQLCSLQKLKVVIIGQDPYHGLGQAHGLSFSVPDFVALPPSLRNIFKEKAHDVGGVEPMTGNLAPWATQGVLLLNQILTVRQGQAGSHAKFGWTYFSEQLMRYISAEKDFVVFLLWGNHAQKNIAFIDTQKHAILCSAHPSPLSANKGGWFGQKPFSKTNEILVSKNLEPIHW